MNMSVKKILKNLDYFYKYTQGVHRKKLKNNQNLGFTVGASGVTITTTIKSKGGDNDGK